MGLLQWIKNMRHGVGESRDYNRVYGQFYVIYPDGMRSENMCLDVAKNYKGIFGGTIHQKENNNDRHS